MDQTPSNPALASSAALKDLQGTSHITNKEREKYLKELDHHHGYGSYIGRDGAVHLGIERMPYVRYMKEVTFEGSQIDTEMRRRRENVAKNGNGSSTTKTFETRPGIAKW